MIWSSSLKQANLTHREINYPTSYTSSENTDDLPVCEKAQSGFTQAVQFRLFCPIIGEISDPIGKKNTNYCQKIRICLRV